ncbi:MAG: hypothetical protein PVJ10_02555 [Thiohalophilus sp.]
MSIRTILTVSCLLLGSVVMSPAAADQDHHPRNNYSCPDDYFGQTYIMANGTVVENPDKTIDQEFGAGA